MYFVYFYSFLLDNFFFFFLTTGCFGLPWWLRGKDFACRAGDPPRSRFDPCVWKIFWRRAWQPTPVFLHGEPHGQRSLVDYSPQGYKELDMTEVTEHSCIRDCLTMSS